MGCENGASDYAAVAQCESKPAIAAFTILHPPTRFTGECPQQTTAGDLQSSVENNST